MESPIPTHEQLTAHRPSKKRPPPETGLKSLAQVEYEQIVRALEEAEGCVDRATSILRISRRTLYRKMDRYRLRGVVDELRARAAMARVGAK